MKNHFDAKFSTVVIRIFIMVAERLKHSCGCFPSVVADALSNYMLLLPYLSQELFFIVSVFSTRHSLNLFSRKINPFMLLNL